MFAHEVILANILFCCIKHFLCYNIKLRKVTELNISNYVNEKVLTVITDSAVHAEICLLITSCAGGRQNMPPPLQVDL